MARHASGLSQWICLTHPEDLQAPSLTANLRYGMAKVVVAMDSWEQDFSVEDEQIARMIFGAGCKNPYPDELHDFVEDWLDTIAVTYLRARRQACVLLPAIPQLALLLDQIMLSRLRDLRAAAQDVYTNPPYYTADRWPQAYLPPIERMIKWAFTVY